MNHHKCQSALKRADAFNRQYPRAIERSYKRFIKRRLAVLEDFVRDKIGQVIDRHAAELDQLARQDSEDIIVREISKTLKGVRVAVEGEWNDYRTKDAIEDFARQVDDHEKRQLGRQFKSVLGADPFFSDQVTAKAITEFGKENLQLITKLQSDVIAQLDDHLVEAARSGTRSSEFSKIVSDRLGVGKSRANLIARDQLGSMAGQVNKIRQTEMGVTKFTWSSSGDERVRPEHEARDGNTYTWAEGADGEFPGQPIQCRCSADPVVEDLL